MKEKKDQKNYYKLSTFVLLGIVFLGVLSYVGVSQLEESYSQGFIAGKLSTGEMLVSQIEEKGFVELVNPQQNVSLILVPANQIQQSQQSVLQQIFSEISSNGYVVLENETSQLVLVPYQE